MYHATYVRRLQPLWIRESLHYDVVARAYTSAIGNTQRLSKATRRRCPTKQTIVMQACKHHTGPGFASPLVCAEALQNCTLHADTLPLTGNTPMRCVEALRLNIAFAIAGCYAWAKGDSGVLACNSS